MAASNPPRFTSRISNGGCRTKNGQLTDLQQTFNRAHNRLRDRQTREQPAQDDLQSPAQHQPMPVEDRDIVAALVILHIEHDRTT